MMAREEAVELLLGGPQDGLRRGKGHDEVPGTRAGPVLKPFEGGGMELLEEGLELVDQAGLLLDEVALARAPEGELARRRVVGQEGSEAFVMVAQAIGQGEGLAGVVRGPGHAEGLAPLVGDAGVHRVDLEAVRQQLRHEQVPRRLDGDPGDLAQGAQPAGEPGEGLGLVGDREGLDDLPRRVDDADLVLLVGPVHAGPQDVRRRVHQVSFLGAGLGAQAGRAQTGRPLYEGARGTASNGDLAVRHRRRGEVCPGVSRTKGKCPSRRRAWVNRFGLRGPIIAGGSACG